MSGASRPHAAARPVGRRPRPAASSPMRVGRLRAWARETIGGILHLPRTTVVDGVRYRERVRESLQRTLSPTGEGEKEYDVRFPGADAPPGTGEDLA